jgi:biotin operon repressor
MNNVRDHYKQSDSTKKLLVLTLATYCNSDGRCFPSNEKLASDLCKSRRTIQRLLIELEEEGQVNIVSSGRGRGQKRRIQLTRYVTAGVQSTAPKHDIAVSRLDVTCSLGETCCNSHKEQPKEGEGRFRKSSKRLGVSFVPYPRTEEEMEGMLEQRSIEYDPDHDGNFFESMEATNWKIRGTPVWDWTKVYAARLEKQSEHWESVNAKEGGY